MTHLTGDTHIPVTRTRVYGDNQSTCQMRQRGVNETYKLRCFRCCCEVEFATALDTCPRCGTRLQIEWREGRAAIALACAAGGSNVA